MNVFRGTPYSSVPKKQLKVWWGRVNVSDMQWRCDHFNEAKLIKRLVSLTIVLMIFHKVMTRQEVYNAVDVITYVPLICEPSPMEVARKRFHGIQISDIGFWSYFMHL